MRTSACRGTFFVAEILHKGGNMIRLACVCACSESFNLQRNLKPRKEIRKRPSQPLDNGQIRSFGTFWTEILFSSNMKPTTCDPFRRRPPSVSTKGAGVKAKEARAGRARHAPPLHGTRGGESRRPAPMQTARAQQARVHTGPARAQSADSIFV